MSRHDVQKRQKVAHNHEWLPQWWYLRCLEVVHDGYGARDAGEVPPECAPEVADALSSRDVEPQSQRQEDACIARMGEGDEGANGGRKLTGENGRRNPHRPASCQLSPLSFAQRQIVCICHRSKGARRRPSQLTMHTVLYLLFVQIVA